MRWVRQNVPMDLAFAYLAGLLTLINPCVLPILPIVLASAAQAHRHGPAAMALGMSLSFVLFGMLVTVFGRAVGLTPEMVADAGAVLMIGFGVVLLVPRLSEGFATATAGFAATADARVDTAGSGLPGQLLGGALLGAVWSPCIGPTLGSAIGLASQGQELTRAFLIMVFFALGVSSIILALSYGARAAILRRRDAMRRIAAHSRPLMGAVFLVVGAMLLLRWHHYAEGWLLDVLPPWLTDLSVRF